MDKNQAIKMFKIAALIYAASFLVINWSSVSWFFNYRAVGAVIDDFFNPYPGIDSSAMEGYFYPNHSKDNAQNSAAQQIKQIKTAYTDKQNILELPSFSLNLPIIFSQNADKETILKDLNKGVVYYPGSVHPGQPGQIVILGHSAPLNWPKALRWQFTRIGELNVGDVVLIDLNSKQYKYIVKRKIIIQPGQEAPVDNFNPGSNILTLISCWPPGQDKQRIAVQAELSD